MFPDDLIIVEGGQRTVEFAVRNDNSVPARDFIAQKLSKSTQLNLKHIFDHIAEFTERELTHEMFCQERKEIHAFRRKQQGRLIRIPCFQLGRTWYLTHGFVKPPKSKWDEQEFTLATEIMNEVLARAKNGR